MEKDCISEEVALKEIVEFLKEEADLDDLAKLYSLFIANQSIRVVSCENNKSDFFKHGERKMF